MELGQFTWANLIALLSLLLVGFTSLCGVWWAVEQRRQAGDEKNAKRIADLEQQIASFRLHVVERYAPYDMVEKSQKRLEDRIDAIGQEVSKMPDVVVERIMRFLDLKKTQ